MIAVETAKVWRGGGRRWFSIKAAINAEARALHRKHFSERCYCSDHHPDPEPFGTPGETCPFHEPAYYDRFTRRVRAILARSAGTTK